MRELKSRYRKGKTWHYVLSHSQLVWSSHRRFGASNFNANRTKSTRLVVKL